MKININYSNDNTLFKPFVNGYRHCRVAFCPQRSLKNLTTKGILPEVKNSNALTQGERFKHLVLGVFETLGVIFVVVPFITDVAERYFNNKSCVKPQTQTPKATTSALPEKLRQPSADLLVHLTPDEKNEWLIRYGLMTHLKTNPPSNALEYLFLRDLEAWKNSPHKDKTRVKTVLKGIDNPLEFPKPFL